MVPTNRTGQPRKESPLMKQTIATLACLIALAGCLASCGEMDPKPDETIPETPAVSETDDVAAPATALNLTTAADGNPMPIIRPEKIDDAALKSAIAALAKGMKETTGTAFSLSDDWVKDESPTDPNARQILVGATNRPASAKAVEGMEAGEWVITVTENQLVLAGTTEAATMCAVEYFTDTILTGKAEDVIVENGAISLPFGYRHQGKTSDVVDLIAQKGSYTLKVTKIRDLNQPNVKRVGLFRYVQGGTVTDKYAYFAMRMSSGNQIVLCQYDVATWELVKQTEPLPLDHGNDITYVPEKNVIYVCHCDGGNEKKFTILDADTLEIVGEAFLSGESVNAYAVAYNPETKGFVTGTAILDENMKTTRIYQRQHDTKVLGAQGVYCDGRYVYHVLSGEGENAIYVYKPNGIYVSKIFWKGNYEAENITVIGDTIYFAANNHGKKTVELYQANLVPAD